MQKLEECSVAGGGGIKGLGSQFSNTPFVFLPMLQLFMLCVTSKGL